MAGSSTAGLARAINRVIGLAVLLVGAALASQLSGFIGDYQQVLAVRVTEARTDVDAIVDRARSVDMPVYAFLNAHHAASSAVFKREGEVMQARIESAGALTQAHDRFQAAGILELPVVLLTHYDGDVAADAWDRFEPSLPRDTASLIYGVAGGLLALIAYMLLRNGAVLVARLIRPRRPATA